MTADTTRLRATAAVSWGPDRIDLFTVDEDAGLVHRVFMSGTWHPATALGGTLVSAPAATAWAPDQLQVFGKVTNVFDTEYEVFGVLGENFFNGPGFSYSGSPSDEQFRTPGAPRGFFVGLRYDFGRPAQRAGGDND